MIPGRHRSGAGGVHSSRPRQSHTLAIAVSRTCPALSTSRTSSAPSRRARSHARSHGKRAKVLWPVKGGAACHRWISSRAGGASGPAASKTEPDASIVHPEFCFLRPTTLSRAVPSSPPARNSSHRAGSSGSATSFSAPRNRRLAARRDRCCVHRRGWPPSQPTVVKAPQPASIGEAPGWDSIRPRAGTRSGARRATSGSLRTPHQIQPSRHLEP